MRSQRFSDDFGQYARWDKSIRYEKYYVFVVGVSYRLVVKINYPYRVVYIRFVGTHAEYDVVDVEEV